MSVQTRDRQVPFSHRPGHEVPVPGTLFALKIFPTLIECTHPFERRIFRIPLRLRGPLSSFTVESDLERRRIRIYGESRDGYFRYVLASERSSLVLIREKDPDPGAESLVVIHQAEEVPATAIERLFLGSGKAKDLDRIRERRDLREILPLWYAIGQMTPSVEKETGPMFSLLEECLEKIDRRDSSLPESFLSLYLAGFSAGFVPRSRDPEFQGIVPDQDPDQDEEVSETAFSLLPRGAAAIRRLFFEEGEGVCRFLPALPRLFPSWKMIGIRTLGGDLIDMEWTKYRMRKLSIRAGGKSVFKPVFPSSVKRYRLKKSPKERGALVENGEPFPLQPGKVLFLDRFEG